MPPVVPPPAKELQQQSISISKAVHASETPVKEKHVRKFFSSRAKISHFSETEILHPYLSCVGAIIGTYQEKGGAIFWMFILRQPLQENRIVAWKFCHVLHKVLREGHPRVIQDSQCHRGKLEDIGKLWQHLREGYGRLIHLYIRLLITKLDFHKRNPGLPGNLQVTNEQLEAIGENDINVYFQMSVEMFDYMDDILNLQSAVYASMDHARANSMTPSGQCRLAPLIPCVQDASRLYDYCVKILFKLHGALPPDILLGHRDRFVKQFHDLNGFYSIVQHMQYFKHLITIPSLPENPPNFLIQSELRTYVTPVVVLPPEEPTDSDATVDSLIDTSDTSLTSSDQTDITRNGSISPDVLAERDSLIEHLHQENARQRDEMHRILTEYNKMIGEMKIRIRELEPALSAKENELKEEKELKEILTKRSNDMTEKVRELEEKNRCLEEKFRKLKEVYSKLREEHISLIRKKAEVDRQLGGIKIVQEQAERKTLEAEQRLQELQQGQATADQEAQRVAQARSELDDVRKQFDQAKTENVALVAKIDFITSEKAVAEGDLHDLLAQKEDLDVRIAELQADVTRTRKEAKADFDAAYYELILNSLSAAEGIITSATSAIENPAMSTLTCTPDYLESLVKPTCRLLDDLKASFEAYEVDAKEGKSLIRSATNAAHALAIYLTHARSTSNISTDISLGDKLTDECKILGSLASLMFAQVKEKSPRAAEQFDAVKAHLENVSRMANTLAKARGNVDAIGNLVENELLNMDKAIEEAAGRIQEMLNKSRAADSGVKLEVNGKILDSCTDLMKCIRILVQKSRLLQTEIVAQGKGTASAKEFYKRNHQWSEGLISAAKAIGMGANFLLEAADKVVLGDGKFEQLVVASQGIAASTAQLVVASRVKADRNSKNLSSLSEASRDVTQATGNVVATAKSCAQLVEENDDFDVSGLTLHQAKRLEMEAQVRVLELEQALETERLRLSALRRHHYQMAGE